MNDSLRITTEHEQGRVAQKDKQAARPKQSFRLRHPLVGIAPGAGAVFGDREIEGAVGKLYILGVRLDERKLELELALKTARPLELIGIHVDAHHARAPPGQPGREVGRSTTELDRVGLVQPGQHVDVVLGHAENAPADVVRRPLGASPLLLVAAVDRP